MPCWLSLFCMVKMVTWGCITSIVIASTWRCVLGTTYEIEYLSGSLILFSSYSTNFWRNCISLKDNLMLTDEHILSFSGLHLKALQLSSFQMGYFLPRCPEALLRAKVRSIAIHSTLQAVNLYHVPRNLLLHMESYIAPYHSFEKDKLLLNALFIMMF